MTKLTTHVLDVFSGRPGKGIKVELFFLTVKKEKKLIVSFSIMTEDLINHL